jgi:hypothetical protein
VHTNLSSTGTQGDPKILFSRIVRLVSEGEFRRIY